MPLLFFGSGAFGLPTLAHLAQRHAVAAVITQPDRPAGRGTKPTPTPFAAWTAAHLPTVPILKPDRIDTPDVIIQLRSLFSASASTLSSVPSPLSPTFLVIAFGQKLPRALLADTFAINLHASLLPRWRGAAPINAAILAGDTVTGNSVITLADRMDAGLILAQSRRPIDPSLTAGELHDLLAADGPAVFDQVLADHAAGRLSPVAQDESLVTLAPKLSKADGWVDFSRSAEDCRRRIHGLTPWPGVTVTLQAAPLKLLRVQVLPDSPQQPGGQPGCLTDPAAGIVACGQRTRLCLVEVQPAGKRPMPWPDFARGHRLTPNEPLLSAPPTPKPTGPANPPC